MISTLTLRNFARRGSSPLASRISAATTSTTFTTTSFRSCYQKLLQFSTLQKGTVLKYDSFKGYGFVRVEGEASDDNTNNPSISNTISSTATPDSEKETVFVHRTDLITDIPLEKLPFRFPYLRRGESVQLEVTEDETKSRDNFGRRAKNVQFLNGKPIPAVRKNFLHSMETRALHNMGFTVTQILGNAEFTDEQKWERIKEKYEKIQENLKEAKQMLVDLGLDPEEYKRSPPPASQRSNHNRAATKKEENKDQEENESF